MAPDTVIQLEAYRLIRKKARNMVEPVDDATLGSYVRGVVDLQAELYGLNENAEKKENEIETNRVGFEADDCNDPMWDKIFEVLKKSDLGLFNVFYLEGDRMELMFKDTNEK